MRNNWLKQDARVDQEVRDMTGEEERMDRNATEAGAAVFVVLAPMFRAGLSGLKTWPLLTPAKRSCFHPSPELRFRRKLLYIPVYTTSHRKRPINKVL